MRAVTITITLGKLISWQILEMLEMYALLLIRTCEAMMILPQKLQLLDDHYNHVVVARKPIFFGFVNVYIYQILVLLSYHIKSRVPCRRLYLLHCTLSVDSARCMLRGGTSVDYVVPDFKHIKRQGLLVQDTASGIKHFPLPIQLTPWLPITSICFTLP